MARKCYHANEGFARRDDDGKVLYHLALITEGEAGYQVGYESEHLDNLKAMAAQTNTARGLSEDDVLDIMASSLAASR